MLRLTCLVFVLAALAAADVQTGVVRSGGQPIPGATVNADCGADKITTVTDGDGRFEMGGLPSTPCKFSVAMFGFENAPIDAKASADPLTFDLKLQTRATLPVASAPVVVASAEKPATTTTPATTPDAAKPTTPTPPAPTPLPSLAAAQNAQQRGAGRGGNGRGNQGRGGQNGQAAGAGFQS